MSPIASPSNTSVPPAHPTLLSVFSTSLAISSRICIYFNSVEEITRLQLLSLGWSDILLRPWVHEDVESVGSNRFNNGGGTTATTLNNNTTIFATYSSASDSTQSSSYDGDYGIAMNPSSSSASSSFTPPPSQTSLISHLYLHYVGTHGLTNLPLGVRRLRFYCNAVNVRSSFVCTIAKMDGLGGDVRDSSGGRRRDDIADGSVENGDTNLGSVNGKMSTTPRGITNLRKFVTGTEEEMVEVYRNVKYSRSTGSNSFHELHSKFKPPTDKDKVKQKQPVDGVGALSTSGVEGEIFRDVGRTFPTEPVFERHNIGQDMLANILKVIGRLSGEVGYCQGMNYVVGVFVMIGLECLGGKGIDPDDIDEDKRELIECLTTWIVISIINSHKLRQDAGLNMVEMWTPTVPGMKTVMYQFECVLNDTLPRLKKHLDRMDVGFVDVCCSQVTMTLHAYSAPTRFMASYMDYILLSGMCGVVSLGVERLKVEADVIMSLDMEGVGKYLRTWRSDFKGRPEDRVKGAWELGVTLEKMKRMEEGLKRVIVEEQIKGVQKIGEGTGKRESWKDRYGVTWQAPESSVTSVRTLFRSMDTEVTSDSQVLRSKITKVSRTINKLHENICKRKLVMMDRVEMVDNTMMEKFNIQRQVEGMVKNASSFGVGGKSKKLLDDLSALQRRATMVESKLSNAVIAKDAIVREVKELTMEYEETVEVKDGYCKALLAITDRYERKREEVVGKMQGRKAEEATPAV
eukprot:CAMPEP_0118634052 /NCGR_PEP_ID=MMETSP0785-20121206/1331_1 /TAXON_ID=91992 /ORGANISM="Bolidomonas pacifica, Strain CCMP 1866" /LENGTH=743 /DNA_ID=CAMNT_0006524981 /DNA_START=94 /DNA_END=2326 /DNA_ORIENTATION=-